MMRAWWIIIFIVLFLEAGTLGVLLFLDGDVSYKNQNDKWDNIEQTIDIAQDDYAIGDVVIIGTYEQDGNLKNGTEPIEWEIIEEINGEALLICCNVLDCMAFGLNDNCYEWETCTLREWLNNSFYNESFTESEKELINLVEIENPGLYQGYDANNTWIVSNTEQNIEKIIFRSEDNKKTQDRIFLLNCDEVQKYFYNTDRRRAFLTDYGIEKSIDVGIEMANVSGVFDKEAVRSAYTHAEEEYGRGFCYWWLRTPGVESGSVAVVGYTGNTDQCELSTAEDGGVRPAMWITLY